MQQAARVIPWVVIPALTFAVGFLLGSGQSSSDHPAADHSQVLTNQEELIRLLREWQGGSRGPAPPPSHGPSLARVDGPGSDGVRLPSLDPWLQRIDDAVRRLEAAADRAAKTAPVSTTEVVRRASDPNLPRNDRALKHFIARIEAAETGDNYDRDWEALQAEYRYQSMEQVLESFGRPDDIEVEVGTVCWYYYHEYELPSGNSASWGVDFSFYDGALIDFSGYLDPGE